MADKRESVTMKDFVNCAHCHSFIFLNGPEEYYSAQVNPLTEPFIVYHYYCSCPCIRRTFGQRTGQISTYCPDS